MSSDGYEDLIDYEDDHEVPNGAAASNGAEEKRNFFGIHSLVSGMKKIANFYLFVHVYPS
jgi:hypothetical protein